jgi:hypothetical protein
MIKGFTFDGVTTPSKVNPFIIPYFSYKTAPSKVNPFIILDLSYKTTPSKVNPFIILDLSYKTAPSKVNYLWWSSLIREIWNDKRVYL